MKLDLSHIAKLANLPLSEEEKKRLEQQLSEVISYVEKLQEVDTNGTEPTSQVTGLENVLREDEAGDSLPQDTALSQAPENHNNMFQVKGIFEE